MNPNESNPTTTADDRILKAVRRQHRWLKWLTALAVAFWAFALIGGIGLIVCYRVFYEPKEKQMFSEYETYGHLREHRGNADGIDKQSEPSMSPEKALGLHFTMNYVVTKALLAVVVTVIVLSCATLATLLLVVLNRRVTLKQINHSLEQISRQLGDLQAERK